MQVIACVEFVQYIVAELIKIEELRLIVGALLKNLIFFPFNLKKDLGQTVFLLAAYQRVICVLRGGGDANVSDKSTKFHHFLGC